MWHCGGGFFLAQVNNQETRFFPSTRKHSTDEIHPAEPTPAEPLGAETQQATRRFGAKKQDVWLFKENGVDISSGSS